MYGMRSVDWEPLLLCLCFRALLHLFLFDLFLRSKTNLDNNKATSLFERLFHVEGVVKVTLLQQHRMPACIASFPNQQYYHGKLRTPPRAPCSPPRGFRWPSNDAICFIDEYGPGEKKEKNLCTTHTRLKPLQMPFTGCWKQAMLHQTMSLFWRFTRDRFKRYAGI